MGRKRRLKELEEKRKERQENNFKKNSYHNMAENGKLGSQELQKYTCMYNSLKKEKRNGFPTPESRPTRDNYNQLRSICCNASSLEYRSYFGDHN